jgi:hypothetical protein
VVEEVSGDDGAPGIAPPPVPPAEVPVEEPLTVESEDELEVLSMDEIMDEGAEEAEPAYKMPKPEKE